MSTSGVREKASEAAAYAASATAEAAAHAAAATAEATAHAASATAEAAAHAARKGGEVAVLAGKAAARAAATGASAVGSAWLSLSEHVHAGAVAVKATWSSMTPDQKRVTFGVGVVGFSAGACLLLATRSTARDRDAATSSSSTSRSTSAMHQVHKDLDLRVASDTSSKDGGGADATRGDAANGAADDDVRVLEIVMSGGPLGGKSTLIERVAPLLRDR